MQCEVVLAVLQGGLTVAFVTRVGSKTGGHLAPALDFASALRTSMEQQL
jgi:hypothetical protein